MSAVEQPVDVSRIHERPVELLQALLRFDTTNPPGNEAACVDFVREVFEAAGILYRAIQRLGG